MRNVAPPFSDFPRYLVIPSAGIGGVERRFIDIYATLARREEQIKLILHPTIVAQLSEQGETLQVPFMTFGSSTDSLQRFVLNYARWLLTQRDTAASFHYTQNCLAPAHAFMPHWVTSSLVESITVPKLTLRNKTARHFWVSMKSADRIDVLNPSIFEVTCDRYPNLRDRVSLTPGGTYVDVDSFSIGTKRTLIVLLARMIPERKGIEDWLEALPEVAALMKARCPKDLEFVIAGRGPLENVVQESVNRLTSEGVPIRTAFRESPRTILGQAQVALSLQRFNNYPSRVVAEARLSGCATVVRNNGESKQFGEPVGMRFIKDELDPNEIAETLGELLVLHDAPEFGLNIRLSAVRQFGGQDVPDYFSKLMTPPLVGSGVSYKGGQLDAVRRRRFIPLLGAYL